MKIISGTLAITLFGTIYAKSGCTKRADLLVCGNDTILPTDQFKNCDINMLKHDIRDQDSSDRKVHCFEGNSPSTSILYCKVHQTHGK